MLNEFKKKQRCRNPGSNQGPLDLQSNALPTELFRLLTNLIALFNKISINLKKVKHEILEYIWTDVV